MAEAKLNDLNSSPEGRKAENTEGLATESELDVDLSNVRLADVPNVNVKSASQSEPAASVRAVRDMSPEEIKALEEKMKQEAAKKFFALRPDAFENAVEQCKSTLEENDGTLLSSWLLTEIDHWDHEKEKIVLLTDKQLVLLRYNFIGLRIDEVIKIPLIKCDKIQTGRFIYPKNTMMIITGYAENSPRMKQSGLRIHYGHSDPGFFQTWNPFSRDLPYVTLTDHALVEVLNSAPQHMRKSSFQKALIDAITCARNANSTMRSLPGLEVAEEEIAVLMYVGMSALVYNQSKLGFCKDRGNIFY